MRVLQARVVGADDDRRAGNSDHAAVLKVMHQGLLINLVAVGAPRFRLDVMRATGRRERVVGDVFRASSDVFLALVGEFLTELRANPEFQHIPVFITTTSSMEEDRADAQTLGVSGYILKPLDFASGTDLVDSLSLLEKLLK